MEYFLLLLYVYLYICMFYVFIFLNIVNKTDTTEKYENVSISVFIVFSFLNGYFYITLINLVSSIKF